MFTLLKLIKPFFLPPTLILLGMAATLLLIILRKHRLAKASLIAALVLYYSLSTEPVAYFLARSLEGKFTVNVSEFNTENIEAIVILGGGGLNVREGYPHSYELRGPGWRRLWQGIELYNEFNGQIPILFSSGGREGPFGPVVVEGEIAKGYAVAIGIPEEKFWTDNTARNTYENGIGVKRLLDERYPEVEKHKILLVTSATHMPRSVKVMERVGLLPIPSPADFMAAGALSLDPLSFLPSVVSFRTSYLAIHEWVGIAGYKLLGRT